MNSERIREIQKNTAYPDSISVQQALIQVWNECEQGKKFPDDLAIWEWWNAQNFQKEQGEQEYTMIYEIDLPKIFKAFVGHFMS